MYLSNCDHHIYYFPTYTYREKQMPSSRISAQYCKEKNKYTTSGSKCVSIDLFCFDTSVGALKSVSLRAARMHVIHHLKLDGPY